MTSCLEVQPDIFWRQLLHTTNRLVDCYHEHINATDHWSSMLTDIVATDRWHIKQSPTSTALFSVPHGVTICTMGGCCTDFKISITTTTSRSSSICSERQPQELVERGFTQDGYTSCQPTIGIKALKGTQSTNNNQWPYSPPDSRLLIGRGVAPFMLVLWRQ